jgi:hypothetical protein
MGEEVKVLRDWGAVEDMLLSQEVDTAIGRVKLADLEQRYVTHTGDNFHKVITEYRVRGGDGTIVKNDVGASILRGPGMGSVLGKLG